MGGNNKFWVRITLLFEGYGKDRSGKFSLYSRDFTANMIY